MEIEKQKQRFSQFLDESTEVFRVIYEMLAESKAQTYGFILLLIGVIMAVSLIYAPDMSMGESEDAIEIHGELKVSQGISMESVPEQEIWIGAETCEEELARTTTTERGFFTVTVPVDSEEDQLTFCVGELTSDEKTVEDMIETQFDRYRVGDSTRFSIYSVRWESIQSE